MKNINIPWGIGIFLFIMAGALLPFCKQNPDPTKPPITVNPSGDSAAVQTAEWYCTPIAPMEELKRAVGMRGKFHDVGATLKIGFIGGTEAQRNAVKAAFAKWKESANLNFEYPTSGNTNIRVSFVPGSAWSYIGKDCNMISQQSATLNYGFGGSSVIEHEAGHAIALLHEQQLAGGICWNEANVIADLSGSPNYWSLATIRFNVLDYHNPENIITSGYDKTSIMHYAIPARWTCNNTAIPGGSVISAADKAFIASMYPYPVNPPNPPTGKNLTAAQVAELKAATVAIQRDADSLTAKTKRILGN